MASLPSTTRLAFVGDGPEKAALQQHFADMPNVKFMVSASNSFRPVFEPASNCTVSRVAYQMITHRLIALKLSICCCVATS